MELPRAPSSLALEQGRGLEEAAAGGDLPTMVVATTEVEGGNHLTTTMAMGAAEVARNPSTPLTCLPERSPEAVAAAEVENLSIPLDCSEERNQVAVAEVETDRDLLMESHQDPVEEEEEEAAGQNPAMEQEVAAVVASFLDSAFLT